MVPNHDHTLGFLIQTAGRLMRRRFAQEAEAFGLEMSTSQWRLLFHVAREEGVSQARLAELLEVEPISVSRLIDRMEQHGWVERRPVAGDRRAHAIFPTAKGRKWNDCLMAIGRRVSDKALDGLPAVTRQSLVRGLEALVENLSGDEAHAESDARSHSHHQREWRHERRDQDQR